MGGNDISVNAPKQNIMKRRDKSCAVRVGRWFGLGDLKVLGGDLRCVVEDEDVDDIVDSGEAALAAAAVVSTTGLTGVKGVAAAGGEPTPTKPLAS